MSAPNAFEQALALLLFNNTDITGVGDSGGLRGSATAGNLYVALHTADPAEAGNQSTNECSYTGYARLSVARSSSGFTVSNGSASNTAALRFGTNASGASVTITHFSVGVASSGATMILVSNALTAPYTCAVGNAPEFAIGQLQIPID